MSRSAVALAITFSVLALTRTTVAAVEPLKIGILMSYTGPNAIGGEEVDAAVAAYQQLHGSTVAGRDVQIIRADTGGPNPDVAARRMQELAVNEKVDFVIGPDSTDSCMRLRN